MLRSDASARLFYNPAMRNRLHTRLIFLSKSFGTFATFGALVISVFSQSNDGHRNNPYLPSPMTKVKQAEPPQVSIPKVVRPETAVEIRPAVARLTNAEFKKSDLSPISPVDIYKIDVGDIIFINLKNAPNSSGYYTVKTNGMIDFPLAGEKIVVAGHTTDEVSRMLAAGITLYADPQVQVKVREYRSHKIAVSGMVDQSGESSLQREAVPLYVICAQSGVDAKATKAVVHRADISKVEIFSLHEANSDKILIYPGTLVEFTADPSLIIPTPAAPSFYYISGRVNASGQKEFAAGITLSQAIAVSGGAKGNAKKALISRKTNDGNPNVSQYDLRAIKDSKVPDPVLAPGDVIEIGN